MCDSDVTEMHRCPPIWPGEAEIEIGGQGVHPVNNDRLAIEDRIDLKMLQEWLEIHINIKLLKGCVNVI